MRAVRSCVKRALTTNNARSTRYQFSNPVQPVPVRRRRRHPLARLIAPCATFALLGYFGFHAMHGQYGVRAKIVMERDTDVLVQRLSERRQAREHLQARLVLLQDGTMERDAIDEYARRQLGMAKAGELVVLID